MDNTGKWWCFGNPYGLSPFHGRSNKEKKRPEAPCDYEAIRERSSRNYNVYQKRPI